MPVFRSAADGLTVGVAHKPNSVASGGYPPLADDHSSMGAGCRAPLATYPGTRAGSLKRPPIWSCTGRGLPSFPNRLENWCALTAPFHPYRFTASAGRPRCREYPFQGIQGPLQPPDAGGLAVSFLLHFPSRCRDSTLWSTLPCGVRTFLRIHTKPAIVWAAPTVITCLFGRTSGLLFGLLKINHTLTIGAIHHLVAPMKLVIHLWRNI